MLIFVLFFLIANISIAVFKIKNFYFLPFLILLSISTLPLICCSFKTSYIKINNFFKNNFIGLKFLIFSILLLAFFLYLINCLKWEVIDIEVSLSYPFLAVVASSFSLLYLPYLLINLKDKKEISSLFNIKDLIIFIYLSVLFLFCNFNLPEPHPSFESSAWSFFFVVNNISLFIIFMFIVNMFVGVFYIQREFIDKIRIKGFISLKEVKYTLFVSVPLVAFFSLLAYSKLEHKNWNLMTLVYLFPLTLIKSIPEELLFRGFLVNYLSEKFKENLNEQVLTILLSAIVFSFFHMFRGLGNVIVAFVLGIVLGALYRTTLSLNSVIMVHGLFNFIFY